MEVDDGTEQQGNHAVLPKKDKSGLPWVEKYRPDNLSELIAHDDIINILNQLIDSNKLPHLLFYGPPGTGIKPHSLNKHSLSCSHRLLQGKLRQSLHVRKRCTEKTTQL